MLDSFPRKQSSKKKPKTKIPMLSKCTHCHMGSPFTNCSHVYLLVLLVLLVPIACSSLITTENKLRKETEYTMHSNRVMLVEAREIFYLAISNIESAKIPHVNKNEREQSVHNCTQWIFNVFGECVVNKLEMSAFWIAISSIGICLLAQLPQMIENMKRQDAGALSVIFLILMLLADIVDCVGTIFIYYVVSHVSLHLTNSMRVSFFYLTHSLVLCWNFLHNYGYNINITMAVLQGENSIKRKEI
jgi:hypothetical protein